MYQQQFNSLGDEQAKIFCLQTIRLNCSFHGEQQKHFIQKKMAQPEIE
jgi:hypothetical protein